MSINVIITGATGMVGEGVLLEALHNDSVGKILVIGRRSCGVSHPKLQEIIINYFLNLQGVAEIMKDYNACFFCLGTSSVGMKEEEYYNLTYNLTMNFAATFANANPDSVFCYVSGAGTDSSENGRLAWARIKGKTENDLIKLPFRKVYNFRPGFMKPANGAKNTLPYYKYVAWLYPVGKLLFPNVFIKLSELGLAMINVTKYDYHKNVLNIKDILYLSKSKNLDKLNS